MSKHPSAHDCTTSSQEPDYETVSKIPTDKKACDLPGPRVDVCNAVCRARAACANRRRCRATTGHGGGPEKDDRGPECSNCGVGKEQGRAVCPRAGLSSSASIRRQDGHGPVGGSLALDSNGRAHCRRRACGVAKSGYVIRPSYM